MKKLRVAGIGLSLFLIVVGIAGFCYLIKIGGAGPTLSWTCSMGPFSAGVLLLLTMGIVKPKEKSPAYIGGKK